MLLSGSLLSFSCNLNNCWSSWISEREKHSSFIGASRTSALFLFAEFPRERTQIYLAFNIYIFYPEVQISVPRSGYCHEESKIYKIQTTFKSSLYVSFLTIATKRHQMNPAVQYNNIPPTRGCSVKPSKSFMYFSLALSKAFSEPSVHPERSRDSGFDVAGNLGAIIFFTFIVMTRADFIFTSFCRLW